MSISSKTDDPQPLPAEVVKARIRDYERTDERATIEKLVSLWREHYPDAAAQASDAFHPLVLVSKSPPHLSRAAKFPIAASDPDEQWASDVYNVMVRRYATDPVFGSSRGMVQLGIAALDGTARHDWRDFQAIKNQLVGPECEAFELYPAESRLPDPSNYWTLWCFPGMKRIKVGNEVRRVLDADDALSPQRKLG